MKPPAPILLQLLYEALRSVVGIVVQTPDAEFLRQKLYSIRASEPSFAPLAFVISPENHVDLWILNRGQPDE